MTKRGKKLTVEIFHDPDAENPCDEECTWRLHSFSSRHVSYRDPGEFFSGGEPTPELRDKLADGTAWVLSYFEHGLCQWMLSDEPKGMLAGDWQWDGVDMAGVLVWENPLDDLGARTKEDRRASAAAFVEVYTQWCNGETYGYVVTDSEGHAAGNGWGLIGTDHLVSALLEELDDGDEVFKVSDQVAGLTLKDFQR